jgi:hypothetical protein
MTGFELLASMPLVPAGSRQGEEATTARKLPSQQAITAAIANISVAPISDI